MGYNKEMKKQELWDKLNDDEKLCDMLFNLKARWDDEREYEDIKEYLTAIQKEIPNAIEITKRPFGVVIECIDGKMKVDVKSKGAYLKLFASSIK